MGRPPIGTHALSAAEKQRRYRERLRASTPPKPERADAAEIQRLRTENDALKAELRARGVGNASPPPLPRTAEAFAEAKLAATQERKATRERQKRAEAAMPDADRATLQEEVDNLRRLRAADRTQIRNLKARLSAVVRATPPRMTKKLYRTVLGFLHPDRAHTDDEMRANLESCFQSFSAIEIMFVD